MEKNEKIFVFRIDIPEKNRYIKLEMYHLRQK